MGFFNHSLQRFDTSSNCTVSLQLLHWKHPRKLRQPPQRPGPDIRGVKVQPYVLAGACGSHAIWNAHWSWHLLCLDNDMDIDIFYKMFSFRWSWMRVYSHVLPCARAVPLLQRQQSQHGFQWCTFVIFCRNFDMKYCSSTSLWSTISSRVAEVWCFWGALNADGSFGLCHLVLLIARVARVKKQVRFQFWRKNWVTGHRGH